MSKLEDKKLMIKIADPSDGDSLTPYGVLVYNKDGYAIQAIDLNAGGNLKKGSWVDPDNARFIRALAKEILAKVPDFDLSVGPLESSYVDDYHHFLAHLRVSSIEMFRSKAEFQVWIQDALRYELLNLYYTEEIEGP